ncbi:nuclear transport factor 2 family protein [Thalassobius vesicularis]|uniref:Nuclear transport factor 2 family protein n=1 Tax=Thalassobius vesicularis TaxID=1294297 RepID=A0A4V3UYZ0_9RHOB|nr:nuclear transport factor 2 family protein [Thalassobius vesicularis]THD73524.1 nuclear transport factor 2 family protein [Thalassobius vesicularis]
MSNTDIMREWFSRVWEQGDVSAIDELFVPDTQARGIVPDMEMGGEEFKFLVATMQEIITPPKVRIDKLVEQDDWIAGLMTMQAESLIERKPVQVSAMVFCRFRDGRIVEAYNNFDFVGFFEQIGMLPENTIALCLSGQSIG